MPKDAKSTDELQSRIAELESALDDERRTSRALREVGNALGTTLELDALLELILAKLTDVVGADRATLFLLDSARQELVSRHVVGGALQELRVPMGTGIAGGVATSGAAVRLDNAYSHPQFSPEWDKITGYTTQSILAVPLKNHVGKIIGVTQVLNKKGGFFTEEDESILVALSTQAAVAIDNSRLFLSLIQTNRQLLDAKDQLERGVRENVLLLELERATARAHSVQEVCQAALQTAATATEAAGGLLLIRDEETRSLARYGFDSAVPGEVELWPVHANEGAVFRVLESDESLRAPRGTPPSEWGPEAERGLPVPVDGYAVAPLEGGYGAIGAIAVVTKRGKRDFSAEDLALLKLVAANAGTAFRLYWASEARERSERLTAIGRLLSSIIHDFKTPMTVISGYVQLMQGAGTPEKRVEYSDAILRQFDQLSAMQREVLQFARGERTVLIRRVYLYRFLEELRGELAQQIGALPIELQVRADRKLVARFDESRVARAIHNLGRNAIEAMGSQGGRLTVSADIADGELLIRVADTGPGIPKEVSARLFGSFVTAGKAQGTGLGLAMVKKVVEEHGGSIDVKSSQTGTTFCLRIPQPDQSGGVTLSRPPPPMSDDPSLPPENVDSTRKGI